MQSRDPQVEDRQKRIQSLWGQMGTVLKQISKQRDAAHFLAPVDVEKLKVRRVGAATLCCTVLDTSLHGDQSAWIRVCNSACAESPLKPLYCKRVLQLLCSTH